MKTLLPLLLLAGVAHAEPYYITIPGEGWSLKLDAPALRQAEGKGKGRRYQFMAASADTGITLSLFSELEGGKSNAECRDIFWPRGLGNPNIVKDTIRLSGDEHALYATHLSEGVYQGTAFKTANGHAYFVKNGLCMDLHVSHWPYDEKSAERVAAILKSATVVE